MVEADCALSTRMDEVHGDDARLPELAILGQPHCTTVPTDTANRVAEETNSSMNAHQHKLFENADDVQIDMSTSGFECGIGKGDAPPRFETNIEKQLIFVGHAVAAKVDTIECRTGSKEHAAGVDKPTHVPSRALYNSEDMRAIARRTPHGRVKESHRDILFGLFFQSNASDLKDLATKTGACLLGMNVAKRKSNRNDTALRSLKNSEVPLSVLSLVPLALSEPTLSLSSCDQARSGIGQNCTDFHGPNLHSVSLSEIESKVMSKFENSSVGQNAIATENPQYGWFFKQIGKELSQTLVPQKTKRFSALPIAYNECSMSAFSKWAFSSPDTHEYRDMHKEDALLGPPALRADFPSSNQIFHLCQICRQWGHFELECADFSRSELRSVLDSEATKCQGLNSMEGHPDIDEKESSRSSKSPASLPRGCIFCNLPLPTPTLVCNECAAHCHPRCAKYFHERTYLAEWLCPLCENKDSSREFDSVVELEGCEGYVIEQTKLRPNLSIGDTLSKSRGINFNERSLLSLLAILDDNVIPIAPKPVFSEPGGVASTTDDEKELLAAGEFCWAKRQHAAMGTIGRDEWWPAQVIGIVANDLRQSSGDPVVVTPYLVKMLALSRASRVRATSILPFLTNFRTVGYRRLSHRRNAKSYVEQRFRIGVQEVIDKMGFKTMNQALTQVDDLHKTDQNPQHQISLPPKRALPVKEQNTEYVTSPLPKRARPTIYREFVSFKQDGFVIRARVSGKYEVELGATPQESRDLDRGTKTCAKAYSRTKFSGCLVAWLSVDQADVQMRVGTVLAAHIEAKMALVRAIPQWESKLRPSHSKNGVAIYAYQTTALQWMPMDELHMISNGPEEHFQRELSQSFVAKVLENSRAKFMAEVAQKGSVSSQSSAKSGE